MSDRHGVLLVDDEEEILVSLERALRKEGYRLYTASDGEEALGVLDDEEVDLILTDIDMPGMGGLELISHVRHTRPDIVRILLTGAASLDSALEAINDGEVHRYLTKPWRNAELRHAIRQALSRLDELRKAAAAAQRADLRERMLSELEAEHPGIRDVDKHDGVYVIDGARADALPRKLNPGELRNLLLAGSEETEPRVTKDLRGPKKKKRERE